MDPLMPTDIQDFAPLIPHLDQYFGAWAIEERAGTELMQFVRSLDLVAHIQAQAARAARGESREAAPGPGYQLDGGVATIEIRGTMTKYGSSLSQNPGSLRLMRAVRQAAADDAVKSILLVIDSPGGTVSGTGDLADAVADAGQRKPVVTYAEDLMASAAYEVGSQAGRVVINNDAVVGSIGTYAVLYDWSQLFAREGVKAVVIRAGQFKGAGTPGTEITADQIAEFQRMITAVNREFMNRVARGRRLPAERVAELATGAVEVGRDAVAAGLADEIGTMEGAMNLAKRLGAAGVGGARQTIIVPASAKPASASKEKKMTDEKPQEAAAAPKAATIQELKAEFPDSTAEWRERCMEQGLTVAQATKAWAIHQTEALKAAEAKAKAAEEAAAKAQADAEAAKARPGQPALKDRTAGAAAEEAGGSYAERYDAAVQAKVAQGLKPHQAALAVNREQPELRKAYEAEVNENRRRKSA